MPKFKDRIADRYGRLVVLEYAGKNDKKRHTWKCLCDCGNEKVIVGNDLGGGKTKSCGCLRKEFLSHSGNQYACYPDREVAILRVEYSRLKKRHKKFNGNLLTFESFTEKSKLSCVYCGVEYSKEIQDRAGNSEKFKRFSDVILQINGIDRQDSGIGYTEDNTVSCCTTCNYAKQSMTKEEFFIWIKRVYDNINT